MVLAAALLATLAMPVRPLHAQAAAGTPPRDSTKTPPVRTTLPPITVTRDAARSPLELPFVTARVTPDTVRPAQRRVSLGDLLLGVPGVLVQERANPSQDPRLVMRGFGARSAFGVRGVRLLRDGIPLSLPDGQTPVDWLELESVGRLEVIRGTAAALYGNAAGGVVEVRSREPETTPLAADGRWWSGGGLTRTTATVSGTLPGAIPGGISGASPSATSMPRPAALLTVTRTVGDGPRQWARLDATNAFARVLGTLGGTRLELQGTRYEAPRAENTGALTAAELSRDPRLPDSLNITKRSRKAVTHQQIALLASRGSEGASVDASLFASTRTLDNPLPFAIVAVDRAVAGGSLRGTVRTTRFRWPLRFTAGVDAQRQDDARRNFENCADATGAATTKCPTSGAERGAVRLDQRELVRGLGAFVRAEGEFPHALFVSVAARRDQIAFRVTDAFITSTNLDDSGERTLAATTPMLGLVWRGGRSWSFFANWTSAFETPTITELTNQEDGSAGLNRRLAPQFTRTVETGVQGILASRVRVDLAAFRAIVHDELVPFDVPNAPGRKAYRNAGQTSRTGVEASARAVWSSVDAGVSYSYAHYRFDRYSVGTVNYAGQPIPGIPTQTAQAWATVRRGGWFGTLETSLTGRMTADDAGQVIAAGASVWGARTGVTAPLLVGHMTLEPSAGVDNLFDRRYAASVVINATRGRFYEPGLPRRLWLAVRVTGH
ncbi:MAG: TonB-dependent receptor [Gemmatimonadaceae bacterium]